MHCVVQSLHVAAIQSRFHPSPWPVSLTPPVRPLNTPVYVTSQSYPALLSLVPLPSKQHRASGTAETIDSYALSQR